MDAMIPKKRPRDSSASVWAECKEEEPEFVCDKCEKVYCVGHLVYHIDSCPGADPPVSPTSSCGSNKSKIRDEHFEKMLASLVIRLGRPFSYVKSKTFVDTLEYLSGGRLPIEVSKENCTSTFDEMYKREKDNLKSVLTYVPGKINFTCDYWVFATFNEFVYLTDHYIDQDWSLKKKMVNFSLIPFPYNPLIVLEHVSDLLKQQGIGQKAFSMIWDDDFPVKICDGVFAGVDYIPICGAGVLNSIVRDAIKEMEGLIHKACQVLQRVRGIPDTKKKFLDCLAYYSLDSARGLRCDVPASWYSTLSMLSGAVYYRSALTRLGTMDEPSEIYPSKEEWDDLEKFYNLVLPPNFRQPNI